MLTPTKRLSTLLLLLVITLLSVSMLPQAASARTQDRQPSHGHGDAQRIVIRRSPATTPTQTPSTPTATTSQEGADTLEAVEVEVLNLINAHREQNGLPALKNQSALNVSSHNHSLDMATHGYFSHTSLDGKSPFDRMREAGYSCGTMGENIAAGQRSAQQAFDGWKNSPGHNANMLNERYASVGIGVVYLPGSQYGYYWTTNFGGC